MQRYFIHLSYDGTNYHGWQIQSNANTVQEELQKALSTILREEIAVTGAGRTDTGVHARLMIAHVDLSPEVNVQELKGKMNSLLPNDIVILDLRKVKDDAHARFTAETRTYEYVISTERDPFLIGQAHADSRAFDVEVMKAACEELKRHTDFESFSKVHTDVHTFDCDIKSAIWDREGSKLVFRITANRFLRNMVRALVGTMCEVGLGKMNLSEFREVILARDRSKAGSSAPAQGLYLVDVKYPEDTYL